MSNINNDKHVDTELSLHILEKINCKNQKNDLIHAKSIPPVDNENIVNLKKNSCFKFDANLVQENIYKISKDIQLTEYIIDKDKKNFIFNHHSLEKLGQALAPFVAYGFLNGGSSSSYTDITKNKNSYPELFSIYQKEFDIISKASRAKPKGITPAYINPDGSLGEDFLALKIRSVLLKRMEYFKIYPTNREQIAYPLFQMDSVLNHDKIQKALLNYSDNKLIKDLADETGKSINIANIDTASQPLINTFKKNEKGEFEFFDNAYGKENTILPMPGGHGQNFYVLKDIYKKLLNRGIRYCYLSNIDNMGAVIDDASIAYLALSGKNAAFDFSKKTPADVKGGILIIDQNDKYNCGDIGVAIDAKEVDFAEIAQKNILFNCATGIFDLQYLVDNIDYVIDKLPLRLSSQKKDAGSYFQAEQVAWEIIGLIDDPLFFIVDKYERFLAAKMLIEGLMASGLYLDNENYPQKFKEITANLSDGLKYQLTNNYGMVLKNGRWIPC